jgi:hypothetical protein
MSRSTSRSIETWVGVEAEEVRPEAALRGPLRCLLRREVPLEELEVSEDDALDDEVEAEADEVLMLPRPERWRLPRLTLGLTACMA